MGNKLFKAIAFATGAAVTYIVASVIANKIVKSEIDEAFVDDVIDDVEEVEEKVNETGFVAAVKNVFAKIRKEYNNYMAAKANNFKENAEVCRSFIESAKTRFSIGLITLSIGAGIVAIGGGLIASSYIKLPE